MRGYADGDMGEEDKRRQDINEPGEERQERRVWPKEYDKGKQGKLDKTGDRTGERRLKDAEKEKEDRWLF